MEHNHQDQSKSCSKCGTEQLLSEFRYRSKVRKDGTRSRTSVCKSCEREYARNNYPSKEIQLERSRKQYKSGYMSEWHKRYIKEKETPERRERRLSYTRQWHESKKNDPDYIVKREAYRKTYYEANKDSILEKGKNWKIVNKEKIASDRKVYKAENKDKVNFHTSKRRAMKLQSVPKWVNDIYVKDVYYFAEVANKKAPGVYTVDHIVPLISDYVCGLHWEGNLQILTAIENASKSNRYWPQMNEITPELKALAKQFKKDNVNKTD